MRKKQFLVVMLALLIGAQCFAAQSVPYKWQNVAMGGGGFVSSVIAAPNDPNIFYARTDVGGAYRWNEATKSWVPLLDWASSDQKGFLGVDGIAVDPNAKGRVYALLGIGYFNNGKSAFARSSDYGKTWEVFDVTDKFKAHGNGMGRGNGERVMVDPNNGNIIFVGSRQNGLWKSSDRGATWTKLSLNYAATINRDMHESGVCTLQFDKTNMSGGMTQTIYAGISRESNNVYVSTNAGASWSLIAGQPTTAKIRPQRMALTPDGRYLYITYGNGAGPHPMLWSGVTDYFNRGAVYKYDTQEKKWTDISPENFMENPDQVTNDEFHRGAFSGISIDPNNPDRILATAINSWRGPQFWKINGKWKDAWGDNIYLSEDGGATWREMFRYYWMDGGFYPDYDMVSENGFPWIIGGAIHWNAAIAFDPYNPERAFVASGNGVFYTENLSDAYTSSEWVNNVEQTKAHGKATWKFGAKGIEETVPLCMASLPNGGPLVSVIGDYDGFVNEELNTPSQYGRLQTIVNGQVAYLGTTTGLAYASKNPDIMAKAANNSAEANGQKVAICGVTTSNDGGVTWNQIYNQPSGGDFKKGQVAVSADGAVVLWAPMNGDSNYNGMFRYINSGWSACQGISFSCFPAADPVNANIFYAYNKSDGAMYVSEDKGATFTRKGTAGTSDYWTVAVAPGKEGEIWIPLSSNGLTRSSDAGKTFAKVSGPSWCEAVGFGKAASGSSFPTVFIFGTIDGVTGIYRSTDQGASWVRVNDDAHQFGGPGNASMVIGDLNVFGRVYMSTAGRGIVYGDPGSGSTTPTVVAVTGVRVAPASATIDVGAVTQLSATVSPAGATNKAVTWRSSNTAVATVNSNGAVTGVAAGSATITATTADGGFTAQAAVTVRSNTNTGTSTATGTSTTTNTSTSTNTSTTTSTDTQTNTNTGGGCEAFQSAGCGS